MNNLLSSELLSKEEIEQILQKADSFLGYQQGVRPPKAGSRYARDKHFVVQALPAQSVLDPASSLAGDSQKLVSGEDMKGKILANLFYEPSTRTRLSFETAMKRLGGEVISVTDMESTSAMKGETLDDTAKVISQFADIVVIRHPESGSATRFADNSEVPVINAGDGAGQHPTQALLDLFTIQKEKGKIDGLKVVMTGDLKYSRCTNSLAYLLSNYDVEFVFISPDQLKMKPELLEYLDSKGVKYSEIDDFKEGIKGADVLYCTRIQKERFADSNDYEELADVYILTKQLVENNCPDATIMHPLPRVHEISHEVDNMPNAAYFRQVKNGVAVRMAILTKYMQ